MRPLAIPMSQKTSSVAVTTLPLRTTRSRSMRPLKRGMVASPRVLMPLAPIDWILIVSYFVLSLAIGLAYRNLAESSLEEYFLSARSLPWWMAGTSMVATTFAADTPLAVTGLVAKNGIAGNWFWWAFALGGMITVFVYARLWRRAGVMTDVEL